MATGSSKSKKSAKKSAKKPTKRKDVTVILDLDELDNLYRRQHGTDGDGDTKGVLRRSPRDGDGDTKG